jgi:hypothetical protein
LRKIDRDELLRLIVEFFLEPAQRRVKTELSGKMSGTLFEKNRQG